MQRNERHPPAVEAGLTLTASRLIHTSVASSLSGWTAGSAYKPTCSRCLHFARSGGGWPPSRRLQPLPHWSPHPDHPGTVDSMRQLHRCSPRASLVA